LRAFKISFNIIIIAMMLMVMLMWFWKNEAFELKAVKIQGNRFVSNEEIFERANVDFSKDIFKVNTGEIEEHILTHPMIDKVSVNRFLPSALKIKIKERDMIAVISGSEISAVDVKGSILTQFPPASVYDLPVITGFHFHADSTNFRTPDEPERIQQAVEILNQLKAIDLLLYHEISELNYSQNHGFILYLKEKNIPIIFGRDDYSQKIMYFSTIYHHLRGKGRIGKAAVIDIRFVDQVVVKNKT